MPNYNLLANSDFFKGLIYRRMQDDLHLAGMAQRKRFAGTWSLAPAFNRAT